MTCGVRETCDGKGMELMEAKDAPELAGLSAMAMEDDEDDSHDEDCIKDVSHVMELALRQSANPTTVNMENSSNVHIGPHLNYNGPVTINQFVNVHKNEGKAKDLEDKAFTGAAFANVVSPERGRVLSDGGCVPWVAPHKRQLLMWGCLALLLMAVIVTALVLHFSMSAPANLVERSTWQGLISLPTEQPPPDTTLDPTLVLQGNQKIYPRWYWSVYEPRFKRSLKHPTPYVVIAHSAEQGCNDSIKCSKLLRGIQSYHVSTFDQPDIGYNFLIDNAGNVYEGRGWDATNFFGEFVKRRNIGVCFIGNYVFIYLTEKQQESFKKLLDLGVKLGKLSKDYMLIAHNQILATDSPGKNVLKVIDSWPHRCLSGCELPFNTSSSTETVLDSSTSPIENSTSQWPTIPE